MVQVELVDIDRRDDAADKREADMIDSFTVQHCEHVSQRSFQAVVAAFEAELGSVEGGDIIRAGSGNDFADKWFAAMVRRSEARRRAQ